MNVLSAQEIEPRLAALEGWHGAEPASIARDYEFDDFASAIAFVNRVAAAAERANHHPDIFVHDWKRVRLTLSTHSKGGLTEADFELASEIDGLT